MPASAMTHIAIHVRRLDDTVAFYERYTTMRKVQERFDEHEGLRTAWLHDERDVDAGGGRNFIIVLLEGEVNPDIVPAPLVYGGIQPISHLGFSMDTREEVDAVAEMAAADGILNLGPAHLNDDVGYIAFVRDPDGNQLEFSHGQDLA